MYEDSFDLLFENNINRILEHVRPQLELRRLLVELRSNGKLTFIITNHKQEYVEKVLAVSLGKSWLDLFDLCITSS